MMLPILPGVRVRVVLPGFLIGLERKKILK
jgi:hypothetical protein